MPTGQLRMASEDVVMRVNVLEEVKIAIRHLEQAQFSMLPSQRLDLIRAALERLKDTLDTIEDERDELEGWREEWQDRR